MKTFIISLILLVAVSAYATPYINQSVWADGALGASPDPLQTILITDNYSHVKAITNQIWYDLVYQNTGTCYIRLMNTNVKGSYVQESISSGNTSSYVLHGNVKYINYSGCAGTSSLTSVLHLQ
jgi:hypothetical protein